MEYLILLIWKFSTLWFDIQWDKIFPSPKCIHDVQDNFTQTLYVKAFSTDLERFSDMHTCNIRDNKFLNIRNFKSDCVLDFKIGKVFIVWGYHSNMTISIFRLTCDKTVKTKEEIVDVDEHGGEIFLYRDW